MDAKRMKMKACLVGEASVGKTALVRRFVLDQFDEKYVQTLGTKIYKRAMTLTRGGASIAVDMTIWDIMGQKGFRELLKDAYFIGAHGILAVADVTRAATLADLQGWIDNVREIAGPVPIVLLANKWDLQGQAEVHEEEIARVAKSYDAPHYFVSAKTGDHVADVFQALADRIATSRVPEPAAEGEASPSQHRTGGRGRT